jgi:pyrimidine-nucleoside phosphorylase
VSLFVEDLLVGMRSGVPQSDAAIEAFVAGVTDGTISRPQAAAWLAWAFARTLSDRETLALTRAMTRSGDLMTWGDGPLLVDKHSTGGVGDKVSLILAPLWAELGYRVPMVSGRGLGHTGGTLDKLESIPGFRTDLQQPQLQALLDDVGCFMNGQTSRLAPADKVLYALRNEIQAVESIPLIVGSILSKKLAEGVERLILDVKTGSGAFMQTFDDSRRLAKAMVQVVSGYGVECVAYITAMERPLGEAIGNAVEVEEAWACLQGGGPADLRELTLILADHPDAEKVLDSGKAAERFLRLVEGHGGDPRAVAAGTLLGGGVTALEVEADRDGVVRQVDARGVGRAAFVLGAGRRRAEDPVDFGVGLRVHVRPGSVVRRGQPLVTVLHRDGRALDEAKAALAEAIAIGDEPPTVPPLIHEVLRG